MAKPFLSLAVFLVWFVAFDASAGYVEVAILHRKGLEGSRFGPRPRIH